MSISGYFRPLLAYRDLEWVTSLFNKICISLIYDHIHVKYYKLFQMVVRNGHVWGLQQLYIGTGALPGWSCPRGPPHHLDAWTHTTTTRDPQSLSSSTTRPLCSSPRTSLVDEHLLMVIHLGTPIIVRRCPPSSSCLLKTHSSLAV